jgi:hypothetical protein
MNKVEEPKVLEFNDLEVRQKADQIFRMIWYNGLCDMNTLKRHRHYIETIAECARELPTVVDYHQTAWVLEWQATDRVRKLCLEFSRLHGLGKIFCLTEKKDKSTLLVGPVKMTHQDIRYAFKWYYTSQHVMFIDSAKQTLHQAAEEAAISASGGPEAMVKRM